jgi:hypothetical protein
MLLIKILAKFDILLNKSIEEWTLSNDFWQQYNNISDLNLIIIYHTKISLRNKAGFIMVLFFNFP